MMSTIRLKDEEEKPGANFVTVLWPDVLVFQESRTILVSVAIFFGGLRY